MATTTVVNISPKVLTGSLCGLAAAIAEASVVAVNQHTLAFLGPWEPLALGVAPLLLGQIAAWFKREEEATEGGTATAAPVANTHTVAPVLAAPVEPLVPATADQIINGTAPVAQ